MQQPLALTVYYFSDTHGKYAHLSKLGQKLNSEQLTSPGLTIFSGDFRGEIDYADKINDIQGNLAVDVLKNLLGTTGVAALGNHDAFGGSEFLLPLVKKLNKPLLAANVVIPPQSPFAGSIIPELIHTSPQGGQYVVLGVTTTDTQNTCKPEELTVQSLEDSANSLIKLIEKNYKNGQRNFIITSHLGKAGDEKLAAIITEALAAKKCHLDIVIFGGHSHDATEQPIVVGNNEYSRAFIVQNAKFDDKTAHLGKLNLVFENGKVTKAENTLFPVSADTLEKDPEIEKLLEAETKLKEKMKANVLTTVKGSFSSLDWEMNDPHKYSHAGHLRVNDSLLMRIVSDAMIQKADQLKPPHKHHAFLQAAWNRLNFLGNADGTPAPLSEYDINQADSFREYIVTMQLTGEQLYQALEQGAAKLNWHDAGGLIHVDGGIQYTYDASKEPGKRIMYISIDGQPLVKDKLYPIVTTRSLARGLADHPELKAIPAEHHENLRIHYLVRDAIKTQFAGAELSEKLGERVTCQFPGATPETLMVHLENKVINEKLPRGQQKPLLPEQLNFDEYLKRQENFLSSKKAAARDTMSTNVLVSGKFAISQPDPKTDQNPVQGEKSNLIAAESETVSRKPTI